MQTSGLTPDHTYTLWWAIFQKPGLCVNGCGDDDINAALAGTKPDRHRRALWRYVYRYGRPSDDD